MPTLFQPFPALRIQRSRSLLVALLAMLAAACAQAQGFDWNALSELARTRAQAPYSANSDKLPADLAALDYDQMRFIRFREDQTTWRTQSLPFEAQFFHLGLYQTQAVRIHEITPEGVKDLPFRRGLFEYGRNVVDPTRWGDLGFAGFRLLHPLNEPTKKDELVAFLGASYFRALGAGQQYGLSARGLAIDTVGGSGEEFPRFTEFWLERPAADAKEITVYALLESPRSTGAYRFVLRPGTQTVMTVHARVYLRPGTSPVNTLGLAPLTSMFLFGENQPSATDFRPEVHDSDGLMMVTGDGEWLWRPLQNPRQLVVSSFAMKQLRGFGLMQRDRSFANYEDVEARYERRPSAWVQPLGDWGAGRVELVQLPTPDETHDNIVAYWVPATLPAPGAPFEYAYELAWQGDAPQRPPSAWVTQSRRGYGYTRLSVSEQALQPQYVLDFAGPALEALPPGAPVRAVVSADANGRVLEALAYPNPATRTWRVTLRVERINPGRPVELRAFLQHQNDTLSETWTQLLLPE
ncbi:MAG: glucan biosynthesis protein G [Hydrogenophaga sp.]|uniref:glucan biosynthesis protein G n=1 Tax=Comamonadaceae TaxID=80864 RepID=UPI002731E681|nr:MULTISPECIES: glucan biosynthesis protein G [Comamonadaceae]MDP2442152.1 glucan biosynthesis protein G [Rhodoferax sp.]MDZ4175683.1 glucan biosynthesis protein G [Hydrogenophaga sp.]